MPGFDQTGPEGRGSMTGRRMGRCTNYGRSLKRTDSLPEGEQNENINDTVPGRGLGSGLRRSGTGRGRGRGPGRQNRYRG